MRQQLERDLVLKPCLKICSKFKKLGYIIKYRRLDALDFYHEPGDPDIEVWVVKDNKVFILLCEAKKPKGGKLSKSQIDYRDKYDKYDNVHYIVFTEPMEFEKTIMLYDNINFKPEVMEEMKSWNH